MTTSQVDWSKKFRAVNARNNTPRFEGSTFGNEFAGESEFGGSEFGVVKHISMPLPSVRAAVNAAVNAHPAAANMAPAAVVKAKTDALAAVLANPVMDANDSVALATVAQNAAQTAVLANTSVGDVLPPPPAPASAPITLAGYQLVPGPKLNQVLVGSGALGLAAGGIAAKAAGLGLLAATGIGAGAAFVAAAVGIMKYSGAVKLTV
jgi:hypothetical protein